MEFTLITRAFAKNGPRAASASQHEVDKAERKRARNQHQQPDQHQRFARKCPPWSAALPVARYRVGGGAASGVRAVGVVGIVRVGGFAVGVVCASIGGFAVGSVISGLRRAFVIGIRSLFFSRCGFLGCRSARKLLIALLGFICRITRFLLFAARLRAPLVRSIVFLLIALAFACRGVF